MNAAKLFDLSGKIALVTGASRGIGEAVARALAAHGAYVIVSSRKIAACETVASAIRDLGGKAEARSCDIGSVEEIERLFADIDSAHGRLDILVNNAGTIPYFGLIEDTDLKAFQKAVDINIRGYFYSSAQSVKLMKRNGGGSIVNVASVNAISPGTMMGIYSISKAAVVSMTKAFARECAASGIRVNALLPGATETRLATALMTDEAMLEKLLPQIPMHRMGKPDEMAGAVLYLASDAASYTTGVCINVDGGFLL